MKKIYRIIAWCFGLLATIVLCGYGIKLGLSLPRISDFPKELLFNNAQMNIALESVKALLPMTSGYILVTAPIVKYLKSEKILWDKSIITGIILTFSFGIIAIGLWSGVFAFLGNAAGGIGVELSDYSNHNYYWNRVIIFSSLAHLSFFCSVAWFITTAVISVSIEQD